MTKYRIIEIEYKNIPYFRAEKRTLYGFQSISDVLCVDIETAKEYIERDKKDEQNKKHPKIVYTE